MFAPIVLQQNFGLVKSFIAKELEYKAGLTEELNLYTLPCDP